MPEFHPDLAAMLAASGVYDFRRPPELAAWMSLLERLDSAFGRSVALTDAGAQGEILRQLVADAPVAMAMLDRELRYVAWSSKWLQDYALTGRELAGRSHYEIFPDIPERWREMHRRCLAGEHLTEREDTFERQDGSRVHLRWAIHPWHDAQGGIGGIVMVTDRIDDLVAAREEAVAAARLKAEFLATMSHEIRTPLNGVIGLTSLLLETALDREQQEYAELIHHSAGTLLELLNDVLDLSKIEAGRMELHATEFSPQDVVEDVLDLMAARAQAKGLQIHCVLAEDVPALLLGDAGRLRQVLLNLVGNALKFTGRGGILVDVRRIPKAAGDERKSAEIRLEFEVRDTGAGIAPELQERIFAAFEQADAGLNRNHEGTGLGLAICRRLAALLGGSVRVRSVRGEGSVFTLDAVFGTLPARPASAPETDLVGLRLLAVLPDDDAWRALQTRARELGLHAVRAGDVRAAEQRLLAEAQSGQPFDLLAVEARQEDRAALDLLHRVAADPLLAAMRRLLLVPVADVRLAEEARAAGVDGWTTMPLRTRRLRTALLSALDARDEAVRVRTAAGSHGASAPEPIPTAEARAWQGLRVLVAEDNPVNQRVLRGMLERLGCTLQIASDGEAAVRAAASAEFDLILMDVRMPGLDGLQACRRLRAAEASQGRPRRTIVALSAGACEDDRLRAAAAGMDDFVAKPFTFEELRTRLAPHCQRVLSGVRGR